MKSFKNIFKRNIKSASKNVETAPLTDKQLKEVTRKIINYNPPQMMVGSAQSIGKQRDHNEDTLYTLQTILATKESDIPIGLYIIADGMGGHQFGDIASQVATKTVVKNITKEIFNMQNDMRVTNKSVQEILEESVLEAHKDVLAAAPGGGTTLTVMMTLGRQANIAHIGDSRIYYFFMDGRIEVVTQDHSLVHRLIELGQISEEEAAFHPQRNVLYKAIGQGDPIKPDRKILQMPQSGYVLLCSDGLWGAVSDKDMFRIIKSEDNLSEACNKLVEAANDNGGPDNISVILLKYIE